MAWEKIKNFLKPTSFKLMVFFILVSVFLLISLYQTFQLYSVAAMMGHSALSEIEGMISACRGEQECLKSLDMKNIRLAGFNHDFILPYVGDTVNSYNDMKVAKTILYPLSNQLVYDAAIFTGYSFLLEGGLEIRLDERISDSTYYRTGNYVGGGVMLPNLIIFDYAPVFAEGFYLNLFVLIFYFYMLSCLTNLFKKFILERVHSRFNAVCQHT